MKPFILLMSVLLYSHSVFALFCPNNFNIINIGDSIDKVKQQCGDPAEETSKQVKAPTPQQWDYYLQPQANFASMKASIVFRDDKVINISINGAGISKSNICNKPVQTGDTMKQVKEACGDPYFITESSPASDAAPPKEMTEWLYNSTPATTLVFENGALIDRKQ